LPQKIVASAAQQGYAGNGQLTVFSTVSIFWPNEIAAAWIACAEQAERKAQSATKNK
jgi:hypothetical protein